MAIRDGLIAVCATLIFACLFAHVTLGEATEIEPAPKVYKVGVAITEQPETWATEVVRAIAEAAGISVEIHELPFKRSFKLLADGKLDCHFPFINPPNRTSSDEFDYSETKINRVNFVLYSTRGNSLNLDNIADSRWKIATEAAMVDYLDFPASPVFSIEGALKMVNIGRLDGFIYADGVSDFIIRKQKLTNINRQLYKVFYAGFLLKKNSRGKTLDKMLGKGFAIIKKNGRYKEINESSIYPDYVDNEYHDWQPWQ